MDQPVISAFGKLWVFGAGGVLPHAQCPATCRELQASSASVDRVTVVSLQPRKIAMSVSETARMVYEQINIRENIIVRAWRV